MMCARGLCSHLVFFVLIFAALSGCGGGGGNPGECRGSDEVCGRTAQLPVVTTQPPVNGSPLPSNTPFVVIDNARIKTIKCDDISTLAEALAYLRAGGDQLDADNDSKPCEEKFPGQ